MTKLCTTMPDRTKGTIQMNERGLFCMYKVLQRNVGQRSLVIINDHMTFIFVLDPRVIGRVIGHKKC